MVRTAPAPFVQTSSPPSGITPEHWPGQRGLPATVPATVPGRSEGVAEGGHWSNGTGSQDMELTRLQNGAVTISRKP